MGASHFSHEERNEAGTCASGKQDAARERKHGNKSGAIRWARQLDGARRLSTSVKRLVSDGEGGVLALMSFTGTADLGSGPVGSLSWHPTVAIARYDSKGSLTWTRIIVTPSQSDYLDGRNLAVDSHHNILVVLYHNTTIQLDGATLPPGFNLVKLDRNGRLLWTRPLPREGAVGASRLLTDNQDHIILAGSFQGTLDFGRGPITAAPYAYSEAGVSSFLARFSPEGENLWTYADTKNPGSLSSAVVDSQDHFLLCGNSYTSPMDGYVLRLSPDGHVLWTRRHVGIDGGTTGVATHGNRVVVSGYYYRPFTFRGQTVPKTADGEGFVAAYTRDGEERWIRHLGAAAWRVAMDSRDGVVLAGLYRNGDDLGLGPVAGTPGTRSNLFVERLERIDGRPIWVRGFPGGSSEPSADLLLFADLALTEQGRPVVIGSFTGPLRVGRETWRSRDPQGDVFLIGLER